MMCKFNIVDFSPRLLIECNASMLNGCYTFMETQRFRAHRKSCSDMNAHRRIRSARRRTLVCFSTAIGAAIGLLTLCIAAPLCAEAPATNVPAAATPTIESTKAVACSRPRVGDQIWLISTRQLGCGICLDGEPALRFWRYQGNQWQNADLKAFLAADDLRVPTDFYIHGNDNTAADANDHGFTVYDRLVEQAPKDRPLRFVIWSWPTDPGRHPVQLVRSHAYRADADAWYLGWLLSRMDRRVPIGLAGYSFGARVATGAIHLMGGGELLGSSLKFDPKAGRPTIRAVLMAAAEDDGWLAPGAPNGMAIPTLDRMFLVNNGCDSTLKHYPLMDRCTHASALGYVGLATNDPKIEQCDACNTLGTEHYWANYFCSDCLVARMRPYLYLAEIPASKKSSDVAKAAEKTPTKVAPSRNAFAR
jgi:hypothetical protein